jgi:hypothetical protein
MACYTALDFRCYPFSDTRLGLRDVRLRGLGGHGFRSISRYAPNARNAPRPVIPSRDDAAASTASDPNVRDDRDTPLVEG